MKKVIIADISSFSYNGGLIGHWVNSAKMYQKILSDKYEVYIAGSSLYNRHIKKNMFILPYGFEVFRKLAFKDKLKKMRREILNCKTVLESDADIIIFQSSGFLSFIICMAFTLETNLKRKRIYFIQYSYQLNNSFKKILFKLAKRHITGLITSTSDVGNKYRVPFLCVPDYIYTDTVKNVDKEIKFVYDFCMVGTMNSAKDVEMVVDVFSRYKDFNVIIAGFFEDKNRFQCLKKKSTENITIEDEYLSSENYEKIIKESRYCLLPYKNVYEFTTSGVIYDYLFRMRPVIYKKIENFSFVQKYHAGIPYDKSIEEVLERISKIGYGEYNEGIQKLIQDNSSSKIKLLKYFEEEEMKQ